MNGPVASLFRVTMQYIREDEAKPASTARIDHCLTVAANDAEAAIARARAHVSDQVPANERARVVCVEFVGCLDVSA